MIRPRIYIPPGFFNGIKSVVFSTVTIMTYNEPYVMLFNNRRKLYLLSLEPVIINNTR